MNLSRKKLTIDLGGRWWEQKAFLNPKLIWHNYIIQVNFVVTIST